MSIGQFFRILWAYRLLILGSTLLCLTVAAIAVNVLPPRYSAQSRVMLDVIRPDPVTGQTVSAAYLRAYTKTQTEMIKDQQVAQRVVKDLGWDTSPAMKREYEERSTGRDLDFQAWLVQRVEDNTSADVIMGSNILEIGYSSKSPDTARRVADALMKAYMDLTLENRRGQARRNAEWYEAQAEKAKTILFAAEARKAAFERESGVVLQADSSDLESVRLQAIAGMGAAPVITPSSSAASASAAQLSLLDAEITEQTKVLGPNHPTLQQLKIRRNLLATQVAQERTASAGSASAAINAARANSGLLESQKAKVMAQREQVERARLMQDEINLRREQYKGAVARASQLRQEAEVAEAGITQLANAVTPQSPDFPKKGLTIGVAVPAGAALGVLIALMLELIGRRVRSADDLGALVSAPVLAVVYRPEGQSKARRWTDIFRPIFPGVRRPARA